MPDRVPERTWAHVISFLIVHMSHFDSCQLTLIWPAHIVSLLCWIGRCDILYQLVCRGKRTGLSSEPTRWSCDNCQRMSDFESCQSNHTHTDGQHNWQASVKLCKIYCDIWHQLIWGVCTGGRTLRHKQIVHFPTRGKRFLDRILTNMKEFWIS